MDLTKMLDVAPGVEVLAGVGKMLKLFYPDQSPSPSRPRLSEPLALHRAPMYTGRQ